MHLINIHLATPRHDIDTDVTLALESVPTTKPY